MTKNTANTFAQGSNVRLKQAEQTGLRLALACRTLLTACVFIWYVLAAFLFPEITPRFVTAAVLMGFTVVGVAHLALIATRYERVWIKYTI